jgi:hypothetical protein
MKKFMINDKSRANDETSELIHQPINYMSYNDEICNRPEWISGNLRMRIRSIVKNPKRRGGWDEVADEIVSLFYPKLSKQEKLVCTCIIQSGRDLNGIHLPSEEIELRLDDYKGFKNKQEIKNTILVLCSKGVIKWMTKLIIEKYRNGEIFRTRRCETYSMNPETMQYIANEAFREISRINDENTYYSCLPVKYKKYLTWIQFPRQFHPIVN